MRNLYAERYALSADITFCHGVCTSFNTCFYLAADNESAIHYLTYSDTTSVSYTHLLTTKTADDFFKEYMSKPENSFVKAYKAGEPNISAVLFTGNDDAQAVLDIKRFITDIVKYYSANYYSNACAKCNSSIGLSFAKASDGNVKQLCKMCVQSEEDARCV